MSSADGDNVSGDDTRAATYAFDESDQTQEATFPQRHVLMFHGTNIPSHFRIMRLPHPRHHSRVLFLEVEQYGRLLELHELPFEHRVTGIWIFPNGEIESGTPLRLAAPFDLTFLAIDCLYSSNRATSLFVAPLDILRQGDNALLQLDPETQRKLVESMIRVAEVKRFEEEIFVRFSLNAVVSWFTARHVSLKTCAPLCERCEGDASMASHHAFEMLAEYLNEALWAPLAAACDVKLKDTNANDGISNAMADSRVEEKKRRTEPIARKSANVKRLEKAGAPRKTPTLQKMFSTKGPS